jgi:hypothetical protein
MKNLIRSLATQPTRMVSLPLGILTSRLYDEGCPARTPHGRIRHQLRLDAKSGL